MSFLPVILMGVRVCTTVTRKRWYTVTRKKPDFYWFIFMGSNLVLSVFPWVVVCCWCRSCLVFSCLVLNAFCRLLLCCLCFVLSYLCCLVIFGFFTCYLYLNGCAARLISLFFTLRSLRLVSFYYVFLGHWSWDNKKEKSLKLSNSTGSHLTLMHDV